MFWKDGEIEHLDPHGWHMIPLPQSGRVVSLHEGHPEARAQSNTEKHGQPRIDSIVDSGIDAQFSPQDGILQWVQGTLNEPTLFESPVAAHGIMLTPLREAHIIARGFAEAPPSFIARLVQSAHFKDDLLRYGVHTIQPSAPIEAQFIYIIQKYVLTLQLGKLWHHWQHGTPDSNWLIEVTFLHRILRGGYVEQSNQIDPYVPLKNWILMLRSTDGLPHDIDGFLECRDKTGLLKVKKHGALYELSEIVRSEQYSCVDNFSRLCGSVWGVAVCSTSNIMAPLVEMDNKYNGQTYPGLFHGGPIIWRYRTSGFWQAFGG